MVEKTSVWPIAAVSLCGQFHDTPLLPALSGGVGRLHADEDALLSVDSEAALAEFRTAEEARMG